MKMALPSASSLLLYLSLAALPSYFKLVLDNTPLTSASVLLICFFTMWGKCVGHKSPLSMHDNIDTTSHNFDSHNREVKVLSYNIFLRPPLVRNNADDFKNERLKEFINYIDKYDIISLQEIFCLANYRQQILVQTAFKRGFKYFTESKRSTWLSGKLIDAGLLILSKYPIVQSDGHIYRSGNQIDGWAAKQVIYAKVQVSEKLFLHVFNTHLQASYYDSSDNHNKLNDFARADQVSEMADFIKKKTHGTSYPVLVTGDFNINSRDPISGSSETIEYKRMMETLDSSGVWLRDLLKEAYNGMHPITYGDFHEQVEGATITRSPKETLLTHTADHCCGLSIDYILYGDATSKGEVALEVASTSIEEFIVDPSVVKCSQLSDHYGITTTLRVNTNAPS